MDAAFANSVLESLERTLRAELRWLNMRVMLKQGRKEHWDDFRLGQAPPKSCILAIDQVRQMARPSHAAELLKQFRQEISDETDKFVIEIQEARSRDMPEAFANGRAFLAQDKAELQSMVDELKTLTNLPLEQG